MEKFNLVGADLPSLQEFVQSLGEPPFRAKQVMQWLYHKGQTQIQHMTNLPSSLRQKLLEAAQVDLPSVEKKRTAKDGTRKYLLRLHDQEKIETVFIPEGNRFTICISSQAGCAMGCSFCATGQGGFSRNLTKGEIIGQILITQKDIKERITNVVVMGMGEPLANYDEVMDAIQLCNDPLGFGIAARKLTISTCGLIPGIYRLAEENIQIVLAVSLHAPTDELRDQIMPINNHYPLAPLMEACHYYVRSRKWVE